MKFRDRVSWEPSFWRRLFLLLPMELFYAIGIPFALVIGILFFFVNTQVRNFIGHYRDTWRALRGVRRSTYE